MIEKMLGCSELENGLLAYRCLDCGELKKVPFSCKSSFCLSCVKTYTDDWVDYISKALFSGMSCRHLVLTVRRRDQGSGCLMITVRSLGSLCRRGTHSSGMKLVSDSDMPEMPWKDEVYGERIDD